MVEAARRDQRGVERVGVRRGRDDQDSIGRAHRVELLAERRDQPRARFPRLGRRQQVLERERLGLVEKQHRRPLGHRDLQDFLQQIAGVGGELRGEVHQLQVIEDRARRRGERLGELRLPGARRSVEEQPLRRLDAPLPVEVGLAERESESLERRSSPAASPPTSSKVIVDLIFVSTRPVRSPYFSPSLTKTSSSRRWSAHSFSLRSGSAMASDRRASRRRAAASLVEDALLDQHRHLRADRQRDRVRRARVELEFGPARVQVDDRRRRCRRADR